MKTFHVHHEAMGFVATSWSFPAGASLDPVGKEGLAHLAGELALRGTARRPREQLARELEFLGCSPSMDVGVESAHFGLECPTRYLDRLLELLSEVYLEPAFEEGELSRLKQQLLGEMADLKDSDSAAASLFFGQALYAGDPYGHPIRGFRHSVESITASDIEAFRRRHYAKHRLIVGVGGAVSEPEWERRSSALLSGLPEGEAQVLPALGQRQVDGLDVLLVTREKRSQAQVFVGQRAITGNSPLLDPLRVSILGFGGTFTAPLVREIREKRGWSYGVSAGLVAGRRSGSFKMRFAPKNSDVVPAIKLSLKLLSQFVDRGPEPKNLSFAQRFMVQHYPFLVDTPLARLDQLLHVEATGKPKDYVATYCQRVLGVTQESAGEALQAVIHPGQQTIVVLGDKSLEKPLRKLPGVGRFRQIPVDWDQELPE